MSDAGASAQTLTIMMTDVEGSTALRRTRGDRLVNEILGLHGAIVRDQIGTCGRDQQSPYREAGDGVGADPTSLVVGEPPDDRHPARYVASEPGSFSHTLILVPCTPLGRYAVSAPGAPHPLPKGELVAAVVATGDIIS